MKNKLSILILTFVSITLMSCSETPVQYRDGGESVGRIFLLINERLVEAHEYVVYVPETKGSTNLEVVSYGLASIEKLGGCQEIAAEGQFSIPASDSELFKKETETADGMAQYKQVVQLRFEANTSRNERTSTFRIHSYGYNGYISDIIVRQRSGSRVITH